jgi:hypothetical protein
MPTVLTKLSSLAVISIEKLHDQFRCYAAVLLLPGQPGRHGLTRGHPFPGHRSQPRWGQRWHRITELTCASLSRLALSYFPAT